jgi:AbiU2
MSHLDDLRDTLSHARLCHEAWWLFRGPHPDREKIVRVFNSYFGFFDAVRSALYVTFIVKLASVFGTRADEITLKAIPDIEQHTSFADLWERGRRLHKYRSKLIAHRDIDLETRSYAQESGFSYDDLKTLLDDTVGLFDSAARRLHIDPVHQLSCEADLLQLVHDFFK